MAETKIRKIIVMVKVGGDKALKMLNTQFTKLNKTVKGFGSTLFKLKGLFAAFIAIRSIGVVTRMADSFQLLSDRITVFTGDAETAKGVFNDLTAVARHTRTSIESLATSYNRIALATQELGLSQDEILATSLALQQTFRISGSTIAEATAATIQLSQGLSSGQLRGQELRSVMEQNTIFAGMLAKELGIARGQLIKFAESGKITSDVVFRALGKGMGNLEKMASGLGTTFEQGANILLDVVKRVVHEINQELGLSNIFGAWAVSVSENIPVIVHHTKKVLEVFKFAGEAVVKFYDFMMDPRNPLGWQAQAIVTLSEKIYNWRISLLEIQKILLSSQILYEKYTTTVEHMGEVIAKWFKVLIGWNLVKKGFTELHVTLTSNFKKLWETIVEEAKEVFDNFADKVGLKKILDKIEKLLPKKVIIEAADTIVEKYKDVGKAVIETANTAGTSVKKMVNEFGAGVSSAAGLDALEKKLKGVGGTAKKEIQEINKEIKKLQAPSKENKKNAIDRIIGAGKKLSKMKSLLNAATGAFAALNAQVIKGAISMEEYRDAIAKTKQTDLNQKFKNGKITLMEYYEQLTKVQGLQDEMTNMGQIELGFTVGIENAIKSVGSLANNIARGINKVMGSLEDQLLNFVKTGKFAFKDFAQVVVDELTKITIRLAILKPLLSAFGMSGTAASSGAAAGGSGSLSYSSPYLQARGGVWNNGVQQFANGGVVGSPTFFPMKNGMGLMAEEGPEAIMPLGRDSQGRLGVRGGGTVVNIVNNSSAEIETKESKTPGGENQIEVLIVDKVSRAIGEGKLDRTFNEVYGLNRRGR